MKLKEVVYKNYMEFDIDKFQGELKWKIQSINDCKTFKNVFLSVLNEVLSLKEKYEHTWPNNYEKAYEAFWTWK